MGILKLIENLISNIKDKYIFDKNFYGYFSIASLCALIDISLLYFLTDLVGILYLFSAILSFTVAQVFNYFINKKFNFRDKSENVKKQLITFITVNTLGLGISLAILVFLVEVFSVWYITAKLFSMGVAFLFNYTIHKKYTFGKMIVP